MDIKSLLKKSMVTWEGTEESLVKDFEGIVKLLSSLPEPKGLKMKINRFAPLEKDEEAKIAKKEDIIKEDMFEI